MRIIRLMLVIAGVRLAGGCSAVVLPELPNRLIGAQGQPILLDDIELIVRDTGLTDDEKRSRLRDLGLEDEILISALLTLDTAPL